MKYFENVYADVNDGWKWCIVAKWICKLLTKIKFMWRMIVKKYEYMSNT